MASLHDLLDFYADRTLRSNQVIDAAPLLKNYRVPKPVLRVIERELSSWVDSKPDAAIVLADVLWEQRWLETRLLAISILGRMPVNSPDPISDRAKKWGSACREEIVIKALASDGIARLRTEQYDDYIKLLDDWYSSGEQNQIMLGLRSTPALLNFEKFDNLPLVFRWIAPLAREADHELVDDLSEVIRRLAISSPNETVFFVRQVLDSSHNERSARMFRKIVNAFPEEMQSKLIAHIREFRANISRGT